MYDSHTHLTSEELLSDLDQILVRFRKAGGLGILNVAFDLDSNFKVLEVSRNKSLTSHIDIYPSLGLHPEVFYSNATLDKPLIGLSKVSKSLKMIKELIERNRKEILAIGETGLDYYQVINDRELSLTEKEEQIEMQRYAFREHVKWAKQFNLPLTIHIRDNEDSDQCISDALKIISKDGNGIVRGSFHSYTGPQKYLEDVLKLGFKIGFNGIITYPSGGNVRGLLKETPLSSILIETDAPYLPPQLKRSSKNKDMFKFGEPVDLVEIVTKVAEVKNRTVDEMKEITSTNFIELFRPDSI